jgi:hypothetical protein
MSIFLDKYILIEGSQVKGMGRVYGEEKRDMFDLHSISNIDAT